MVDSEQKSSATANATRAPLVVGITSHRNIAAREIESLRRRVRELFLRLREDFPHAPLTILSPLAEGGDQLVAEEGLKLGARLVAPLPFARELYAQDFAGVAARERFESLCAQARLIELPLLTGHTHAEVSAPGDQRNRQYAHVGMFVARHCHLLLAIWDGKPSHRLGGTAQIVDYFLTGTPPGGFERRRDKRPRLYGGGDERLLCHLVCSRDMPDGTPATPLQPGQVIWRNRDEASAPDAPMPQAFSTVFAHTDAFNADAVKYADEIEAGDAGIDDGASAEGDGALAQPSPATLFRVADWLAIHFQRRVLLAMRVIYLVAFVMGVAFTMYDNLPDQDHMLFAFLFLFATGVVVNAIARRRDWHRKYLDYRALAEGLRVQCYWRRAGISLTGDPEFARDSLMQKQDIELGWVRNVMRSAGLFAQAWPERQNEEALRGVIDEWVGDATHGELGYYRVRTEQRERSHRINEAIGAMCLLAGIFISVVLAVLVHTLSNDAKNDLIVVMAVFSIFAAVREAYSFRKADRELIRQYRFMERVFGNARSALDKAEDTDEQREILQALGEASLAEHVEWAVMHRQRPLEAGKM
ncbi:MAG: DUF4231 domain-containing protein [Xanthomonadales bacterium]|nr:DUF4231 domain-containing protein [Xanthomonadales bacterium]ODU92425.1 MAG: hypothetical protein ABT18_12400 [Rhodanobacter sp. SCN 66-43]OJY86086.1 MAG: hypothetical protein BGP23_04170 [Xanthomonadales bacterium 66-474]